MKNHGVEISIAGGVEEMVRAHPLGGFCFFCFNHSIIVLRYKLACSASYGGKTYKANKPISTSDQGSKPETPRPSGMGPTARQLHKSKEIHREEVTRKPLPTSRKKRG